VQQRAPGTQRRTGATSRTWRIRIREAPDTTCSVLQNLISDEEARTVRTVEKLPERTGAC
jgi:hypothetical protein